MKIYKKTIFTTILFLICITNTYAACTQEEINEFKKIEDQYTVKYEFNNDTKDYNITFNYPQNEKYTYQRGADMENIKYVTNTDTSITYSGLKPGEYQIEIIGISETCNDLLKKMTLKLAKYNNYSNDPLCEGIEEFVLCQPTYDKDIDYDTFVSRVNTYKKTKEKKEQNEQTNVAKEENKILSYIKDNIIPIIITIIFIILVLITTVLTVKSYRKSRRLE